MVTITVVDLPDYEKKVVVVTIPGDYPAEMQIDHRKILGEALKTPTFAQCVPSSIENDALAYDAVTDKFYVWAYGNLDKLQQRASTLELLAWINNFPSDFPDASSLAKLDLILAQLDSKTSTLFKAGQNIGNAFALESGGNLASILAQLDSKTSTLFKAGQNIGNTGFNVNNFPTDYFKAGQVIGSLPAGTNTIGYVKTLHDLKTYKTARFKVSTSGDNTIVAAVSGKVIKIHEYSLQAQGTVIAYFADGAGTTAISQEWSMQDREGVSKPFTPAPAYKFKTSSNTLLNLRLSAAVTVSGEIVYSDDDAT